MVCPNSSTASLVRGGTLATVRRSPLTRKMGGRPTFRWTSEAPSWRAACSTLSSTLPLLLPIDGRVAGFDLADFLAGHPEYHAVPVFALRCHGNPQRVPCPSAPPSTSSPLASPFGDFGTCTFPPHPLAALAPSRSASRDGAPPARARDARGGGQGAGRPEVPTGGKAGGLPTRVAVFDLCPGLT